MTHATKPVPRLAAIPAATLATLLLAGCSTGHIGESWQCPLAEGGTCDSVAVADPAVPDAKAAGTTALAQPLWRTRGVERPELPAETSPARRPGQGCATACGEGFDPFAWLARLFGGKDTGPIARPGLDPGAGAGGDESADRTGPGDTMPAAAGPPAANPSGPGDAAGEAEASASPTAPAETEPEAADPAAALLPADPDTVHDDPDAGDLRTDEVVARIWIAPFVDADGVYREASHVRVVLEPAGWRLP